MLCGWVGRGWRLALATPSASCHRVAAASYCRLPQWPWPWQWQWAPARIYPARPSPHLCEPMRDDTFAVLEVGDGCTKCLELNSRVETRHSTGARALLSPPPPSTPPNGRAHARAEPRLGSHPKPSQQPNLAEGKKSGRCAFFLKRERNNKESQLLCARVVGRKQTYIERRSRRLGRPCGSAWFVFCIYNFSKHQNCGDFNLQTLADGPSILKKSTSQSGDSDSLAPAAVSPRLWAMQGCAGPAAGRTTVKARGACRDVLKSAAMATFGPPKPAMQYLKFAPMPLGRQHYSVLQKGASQNYFEIAAGLYVPRLAQIRALLNFATAPSPTSGFRLKSWHSETKCGSESKGGPASVYLILANKARFHPSRRVKRA